MTMFLTAQEKRSGVSLENPNVPLSSGFTLLEVLGGGTSTASGVRVNAEKAMMLSAVRAAIFKISSTVAKIPLKVYQRRSGGGKDEVRTHRVWDLFHPSGSGPNADMTALTYFMTQQAQLLTRGNAVGQVKRRRGEIEAVIPVPADRVQRNLLRGGGSSYRVTPETERPFDLREDEVVHVVGLSPDGYWGWSVIRHARESLGAGLASQNYAAQFFGNGAMPTGLLIHPESIDKVAQQNIRRQFEVQHATSEGKAHRIGVFGEGMQYKQVSLTAEDAQFIQTREHDVREVCRWFNIPPHKIFDLKDATFSNIFEQNLDFMNDTIDPWLVAWEATINKQLLTSEEREAGLFVQFVRDAQLQSEPVKRSEQQYNEWQVGGLTTNEIRAQNNRNPIEGGDVAYVPLNFVPIDQAQSMSVDERARLLSAANGELETRAKPTEYRSHLGRLAVHGEFRPSILDAMARMIRGEVRNLRRGREATDTLTDFLRFLDLYYFDEHPDYLRRTLDPVLQAFAAAIARESKREVDSKQPVDIGPFTEAYMDAFSKRYSSKSRRELLDVVDSAEDAELDAALDARYERWVEGEEDRARPRAEIQTDQEITQMGGAVARTTFSVLGVVALRWMTVGKNCPYCTEMNGKRVGIQDAFFGGPTELQPEGVESPLKIKRKLLNPPLHGGCDCLVVPSL